MQSNVTVGGRTIAAGLNWTVINKSSSLRKKDIKRACIDTGLKFGVVADGPEVAAIGLCAKKLEHASGAALLAAANNSALKDRAFGDQATNTSWILVEKIRSNDRKELYWLCAITDGVPVPGTDLVEELTVISAKLAELIEILESVDIYSPDEEIREYVATGNFEAISKSFGELVENVSLPKGGKPQKVEGVPDVVIFAVVGVVAVAMAGAGYLYWAELEAKEVAKRAEAVKRQRLVLEQQRKAAEANEQYQSSVSTAKDGMMAQTRQALSYAPDVVTRVWATALETIPVNTGGWDVKRVLCDISSCEVILARDPASGTNESLRELVPSATFGTGSKGGAAAGEASYIIPLNMPMRSADVSMLSEWTRFEDTGISQLQKIRTAGIDTSLGAREDLTFQPPPLPATSSGQTPEVLKPEPLGISRGSLSLGSLGLWKVGELGELLHLPEVVLERFEVSFGKSVASDANWRILGRYYVKSPKNTGMGDRLPAIANAAPGGPGVPGAPGAPTPIPAVPGGPGAVAATTPGNLPPPSRVIGPGERPQPPVNRPIVQSQAR